MCLRCMYIMIGVPTVQPDCTTCERSFFSSIGLVECGCWEVMKALTCEKDDGVGEGVEFVRDADM